MLEQKTARRGAGGIGGAVVLALLVGLGGCGDGMAPPGGDGGPRVDGGSDGSEGCAGCVADGVCKAGKAASACGEGGRACVACKGDDLCVDGACRPKPACSSSCAGCCTSAGVCRSGDTVAACGARGADCNVCADGWKCGGGKCVEPCGPGNCPGCCDAAGACITEGQTAMRCGVSGASCAACGADEACGLRLVVNVVTGETVKAGACDPAQCAGCAPGCCAGVVVGGGGVVCDAGEVDMACGKGGESCRMCGTDETCKAQRCEPKDTARYELRLLSAVVPNVDTTGSPADYLSPPDVLVDTRVSTAPVTNGVQKVGTPDSLTPTFSTSPVLTLTVAELMRGITFTVLDDDSPDADDLLGTNAAMPWVPPIEAFLRDAGGKTPVVELVFGGITLKAQLVPAP